MEPAHTMTALTPRTPVQVDPLIAGALRAGPTLEFDALLSVCARLTEARPVEDVLAELLLQARRLTRAEAGTVLINDRGALRFVCAQNDARPDLDMRVRMTDRRGSAPGSGAASLTSKAISIDDASIAGYCAGHTEALRLDDVHELPAGAPYRFDGSFDARTGYRTVSMLAAPLVDGQGRVVGVLQAINKRGEDGRIERFSEQDQRTAAGLASLAAISVRNSQMRDELARVHLDTILRLATAAEFRDSETSEHIRRVSLYCETAARAMGAPADWARMMMFASPMHDVGKLGVPDAVLRKPGKLTPEERTVMETHTTIGGRILSGSDDALIRVAERIARTHHEKWDGTGYPNRIAGEEIPLEGRVTAVADVFDALTSKRVYKPAFDMDWSFKEIEQGAGKHFDPGVVAAFLKARDEVEAVFEAYKGPPPAAAVESGPTPA